MHHDSDIREARARRDDQQRAMIAEIDDTLAALAAFGIKAERLADPFIARRADTADGGVVCEMPRKQGRRDNLSNN